MVNGPGGEAGPLPPAPGRKARSPAPDSAGPVPAVAFPLLFLLLILVTIACRPRSAPVLPTPVVPAPSPSLLPAPTGTGLNEITPSPGPTTIPTEQPSPTPTSPPTATPCASAGSVISSTFPSATAGSAQRYRLYLPPCYGADGRVYPTLILMAGNIHDEKKWDELGLDEAADEAIAAGTIPPLIVVMPDGGWLANNTSGGPGSYESVIVDELLPHIEASYCAWKAPAGRAIGGLSRGGYWALEIAFRFPELFASVGGHSAALLDQYAGPALNPQQTGVVNDLGDLRVWLDIGASDYLRENTIRLHREMETAGVAHAWYLNEGRHEDAYWAAHVGDYLQWYAEPWPVTRTEYPACE